MGNDDNSIEHPEGTLTFYLFLLLMVLKKKVAGKLESEERPFILTEKKKLFLKIIDKRNLMRWNASYQGHLGVQLGQAPIIVEGTN